MSPITVSRINWVVAVVAMFVVNNKLPDWGNLSEVVHYFAQLIVYAAGAHHVPSGLKKWRQENDPDVPENRVREETPSVLDPEEAEKVRYI